MIRTLAILYASLGLVSCSSPSGVHAFIRQPLIIPILYQGKELYQGIKEYKFTRGGKEEVIEKGFTCDGASVPVWARFYVQSDGLIRPGAYCHDWTYELQGHLRNRLVLNRLQADQMLYDYMIEAGISRIRAGVIYRCVRIGGGHAWATVEKPLILPVNEQLVGRPLLQNRNSIYYVKP